MLSKQPTQQLQDEDESDWPECTVEGCHTSVNPRRIALTGHGRCLEHGDSPKQYTVGPAFNKGGDQFISSQDIKHMGKK